MSQHPFTRSEMWQFGLMVGFYVHLAFHSSEKRRIAENALHAVRPVCKSWPVANRRSSIPGSAAFARGMALTRL
jgi:hypothetical protein